MDEREFRVGHASHNAIVEAWRGRWGGDLIVSPRRDYRPEDVEGLDSWPPEAKAMYSGW